MNLRVFYGLTRLTPKAVRNPEVAIYFENADNNPRHNEEWVQKRMEVIHQRWQTEEELIDCKSSNRMFTKYGYHIDKKPYNGDIDRVLLQNYYADVNHVSTEERKEIRDKLRKAYFPYYHREDKKAQMTLNFEFE